MGQGSSKGCGLRNQSSVSGGPSSSGPGDICGPGLVIEHFLGPNPSSAQDPWAEVHRNESINAAQLYEYAGSLNHGSREDAPEKQDAENLQDEHSNSSGLKRNIQSQGNDFAGFTHERFTVSLGTADTDSERFTAPLSKTMRITPIKSKPVIPVNHEIDAGAARSDHMLSDRVPDERDGEEAAREWCNIMIKR